MNDRLQLTTIADLDSINESLEMINHQGRKVRTLLLNSLTTHYADLWEDIWQDAFTDDTWTKDDPRLNTDTDFSNLTGTRDWDTPLRTRYARQQALVELDVLAAQALGLTLDELQTVTDDTQPGGPVERTITYEAPFTKCDREADYERAWGEFESRTG